MSPWYVLRTTFALVPLLLLGQRLSGQDYRPERRQDPAGQAARPGGPGPAAQSGIVTRGPFTSVQVNTDSLSNNIKGDAANEPSIGIDPTDPKKMVIGWRQFDTTASNFRKNGWGWSHDRGKTWTFPGSIQPTLFNSDPVVDTDLNGNFYYLSYPTGTVLKVFKSTTGGKTWTGPVTTAGGDKAWMTIDRTNSIGQGHIYIIWQVLHGPATFIRSTNAGASFSAATTVPLTPTFGTLATDTTGDLYAAGLRAQVRNSFVLAKSTNAKNKAQTPTFSTSSVNMGGSLVFGATPNPGGLLGQVQVATDPSRPGYVYMLCSVDPSGSDPMDVHFIRSTNGGASFSPPVRVNDDGSSTNAWQWFGTFSVSPNGRIDVVWNDTRNGSNARLSETFYAYSLDAGSTWSRNIPVTPQWNSTLGWPNQNKIGDYYDMRSDDASAHLAYSATFNGEQDVYYLRLGDCNDNGVHDSKDIKDGTSFDSNHNTIPDECEFCQKDLGNGSGLTMLVCGDDLTTAGSRATLQVEGGPAQMPVIVALALGRNTPPIPLPGGGNLVPDLFTSVSLLYVPGVTNAKGKIGVPIAGRSGTVQSIYGQSFMIQGSKLLTSNAVEIRIGK